MTQARMGFGRRIGAVCSVIFVTVSVFCAAIATFVVIESATFLTGSKETFLFLCLPLLVGAGALVATRLAVERKLKLLVLLVSTTLSLLAAEFYLLASDSYRKLMQERASAAAVEKDKHTWKSYDDRSIQQFFTDHWKQGTKLYPKIYQLSSRTVTVDQIRVFPTSNLSNQRIVECFADGRYKVYLSDEYGFMNPHGLHGKPARVVLVGDSFTAGDCVSTEEDIGARLRRFEPATVNLGIGGAGPFWELANLVEFGLPLDPEYVFWLYYEGNDLADLIVENAFPELTRYLGSQEYVLRPNKAAIDEQVGLLQTKEIESLSLIRPTRTTERKLLGRLLRFLSLSRLRMKLGLHRDLTRDEQARIETLAKVILRAKVSVERGGGKFVFVYVPDFSRFVGGSEKFDRDRVIEMLSRNDVRWIDLLPELEAHPDVLSLYPHRLTGHFNAAGYEFIAERLRTELSPQ